jgi:argininosuccinate lyase
MIDDFDVVLDALTINPKRSLEELEDDWTTSMELAETLQMEHKIPFRVGHTFASSMVTYARANGLRPKDFPYAKAVELYAKAIQEFKLPDPNLPIKEAQLRQVLSPEFMVKTRVGIGGPQPAEVERMLGEARSTLQSDKAWMQQTRQKIQDADARLDRAFGQLLK